MQSIPRIGVLGLLCIACTLASVRHAPAAPLIVNEYNAVGADSFLNGGDATADQDGGAAADPLLGRAVGNGGDWLELVVVADGLDVRGWEVHLLGNDDAPVTILRFSAEPLWAELRAGTIVTIAEEIEEDTGYDPSAGDWWIAVRSGAAGSGRYVSAVDFDTSNQDTRFEIRSADGHLVVAPGGEGVSPRSGVNSREVFASQADPHALVGPASPVYAGSVRSSFGAPNRLKHTGHPQNLEDLRNGTATGDADRDGVPDCADLCPAAFDPVQLDSDGDGDGDACDADQGGTPGPPPGNGGCEPEPFDPNHVLEVEVRMSQSAWDALRLQARPVEQVFGCETSALPDIDIFDFRRGDVLVDGHLAADVGIRKKGFFGSLDTFRPSLKVKFAEYVDDRTLLGLERMTLNNSRQDASRIEACIGYALMRAAGVHAPRCSFAHVAVTTENATQDLGLYVHVDSIETQFLDWSFGDGSGNLYEGVGGDFRPTRQPGFAIKNNEDTNDGSELDAITMILAQHPDEGLFEALEQHLDLDAFFTYWAMEALTGHWDSYSGGTNNNFFLYRNPGNGLFYFIPWGMDDIFTGSLFFGDGDYAPLVMVRAKLARRLYFHPQGPQRYAQRLAALFDTVWDETALLAEINRIEALTNPIAGERTASIGAIRAFVNARQAQFAAEFGNGPPQVEDSDDTLLGAACLEPVGNFSADFSTRWHSVVPIFPQGPMSLDLSGQIGTYDLSRDVTLKVLAAGGPDAQSFSAGVFRLVFALSDRGLHVIQLGLDPGLVQPGTAVGIEGDLTNAFIAVDAMMRPAFLGVVTRAAFRFDESSGRAIPGEQLVGHVDGDLSQFVARPGTCPGDCNADYVTSVPEIVGGVEQALGRGDPQVCFAIDRDEDLRVTVNELVRAVGFSQGECPRAATFIDLGGTQPPPF